MKLNGYQSSKPLSAHDKISAKHFSHCQKALKKQQGNRERTGLVWKGRAQLPVEEGSTTLQHSIMFALAGRAPAMVLFRDWAKRMANACSLLCSKSRHLLIFVKRQYVTRNSYTVPKWRDIPKGCGRRRSGVLLSSHSTVWWVPAFLVTQGAFSTRITAFLGLQGMHRN